MELVAESGVVSVVGTCQRLVELHGRKRGLEASSGSQDPQEERCLDLRVGEESQDRRDKLDRTCPALSRSPPTEDPAPKVRPERIPGVEGWKRKKTLARRSRSRKIAVEGASGSEEDLGDNLFNNRDLIKRLVEGCILPEVIERIVLADLELQVWNSLGSFLEIGHQLVTNIEAVKIAKREAARAEEGRLAGAARLEEKIIKVLSLREVLEKEGHTSSDLRTALEEERGKAEAEISRLRAQVFKLKVQVFKLKAWIPSLTSEAGARAVEEFKASSEMKDLKVQFGQDAFIKGFELCQEKVAGRFPELDLGFLNEASDDEARPSEVTIDPLLAGTSSTAVAAANDLPEMPTPSTSTPEVRNL
ncbi:uncharacterized protein [Elaeis guineensis]|uniref:uncharacterized protein n=1 Tax=Elaeis guineensis var. tenera TaxID=51953 RepID=UPI003C6D2B34